MSFYHKDKLSPRPDPLVNAKKTMQALFTAEAERFSANGDLSAAFPAQVKNRSSATLLRKKLSSPLVRELHKL
ncbi:hypothetical protein EGM70_15375 [Enterobacteriaceae bacterium 89]|nr:hypothetical protein [Enterobacteriaceae bacterium 89]